MGITLLSVNIIKPHKEWFASNITTKLYNSIIPWDGK